MRYNYKVSTSGIPRSQAVDRLPLKETVPATTSAIVHVYYTRYPKTTQAQCEILSYKH